MINLKKYLIKEEIGFLRLSDRYRIYNPETGKQVGCAKENQNVLFKLLRLVVNKSLLPTSVEIVNESEELIFTIKKSPAFFRAKVEIFDSSRKQIGYFKSKFLSIGGKFDVFDIRNAKVAEIKGDWKGWNFRFLDEKENELGSVTKKWAGISKELFTSADNYLISINENISNPTVNVLLLAAGLAVDIVYKENK